jgi:tripartite-type tricarboxylate transporter receptor subunit TctC
MKTFRALIVLGCFVSGMAFAQEGTYPSKTIRIVVSAAAGGVTDILGRALAQHFTDTWRQTAVVENRAGGNNVIAAEHVARSAPDGYTLLLTAEATFVVNPAMYSKLSYDPVKDFAPITGLVRINHALVAHPSLQAKDLGELIALAKSRPGELSYGSFGTGSSGHVNMELLQGMAGVKFNHIQYKGATPALTDVAAGHLTMMFISVGSAIPPWKAGRVKWLAIGSSKRLPQYPEIPTLAESGLPGFEATSWFGLFATGGTPPEVVAKLNAETRRVFSEPAFRQRYLDPQLFEPIAASPEQFGEFIRAESLKWGKVLREANVRIN